jgi:nitrogenase subunit NifH
MRCWCATQAEVTILYRVSLFATNSVAATVKVLSRYNGKKLISLICSSDNDLRKEKSAILLRKREENKVKKENKKLK